MNIYELWQVKYPLLLLVASWNKSELHKPLKWIHPACFHSTGLTERIIAG
jgi:hypothetical protein